MAEYLIGGAVGLFLGFVVAWWLWGQLGKRNESLESKNRQLTGDLDECRANASPPVAAEPTAVPAALVSTDAVPVADAAAAPVASSADATLEIEPDAAAAGAAELAPDQEGAASAEPEPELESLAAEPEAESLAAEPEAEAPAGLAEAAEAEPEAAEAEPEAAEAEAAEAAPAAFAEAPSDVDDIDEIQGIGPSYKAKLGTAGIATIAALLENGASAAGRESIAAASGISVKNIVTWVNHADLLRIPGVDPQAAELLEVGGVSSPAELAGKTAAALYAALAALNAERNIAPDAPAEETLAGWIGAAATLPAVVTP